MNQIIEIHEFSTGIQVDGTPDNWVSKGFAGKYMNSTFESIPAIVDDAINSDYFKIAESTSSDKPAVIGREIVRNNEQWSVVAVVTSGDDYRSRTASLYRYFLCQGAGNIHYILQWMNREKGGIMMFDPFDTQNVDHPHQYQITSSKAIPLNPKLINLLNNSLPVIVPFNQPCSPLILNRMANCLEDHPVSWASNVKAIEKPRSFQIIQPADSQSEEVIRRAINKTPKQPQLWGEEYYIITAIKGLTVRNKFKLEHITTIEQALANPKINDEVWKHLFEQLNWELKLALEIIYTLHK